MRSMLPATKFEGVQSPRQPQMAESARLKQILATLEAAEVVEPSKKLSVCRDPHDDKFFECAVEGQAQCIVTRFAS
jgi:putative PIN family toxin of toxin-antitoxin system